MGDKGWEFCGVKKSGDGISWIAVCTKCSYFATSSIEENAKMYLRTHKKKRSHKTNVASNTRFSV